MEEEIKTNEPASDITTTRSQAEEIVSVSSVGLEEISVRQSLEVGQTSTSLNEVMVKMFSIACYI
jgi:hypothetical protein